MKTLWDLDGAIGRGYRDEFTHDQKQGHTDTIKFRMGSWLPPETGYFGALSFDFLTGDKDDPHRAEKVMIKVAYDDVPGHPELGKMPMLQVRGQLRLDTTQDETDIPWFTVCSAGFFPHVKMWAVTDPAAPAVPRKVALKGSNGKYLCSEQHLPNVPVTANRPARGPWEEWTLEIVE